MFGVGKTCIGVYMEYNTLDSNINEKKSERFVVLTFLSHHVFMFIGALNLKWESWIPVIILGAGAASLVVLVGKYWNYITRAMFCTMMICFSLVIYGIQSLDFNSVIVPFISVTILIGWYSIEKLLFIPFISTTFFVLYHMLTQRKDAVNNLEEFYTYYIPILNVYFIIIIIYLWVKRKNQNSEKINSVIKSLKVAERGKDDLLANVSHEIRTPINTITGMSEVILREDEINDKVREQVLDIQLCGRQLVSIVSDILDFSELQSGKQEITEVAYNISSTINDIINMANAMKKGKNIEFIVECDANMPSILLGDEQRIRRTILNLINNAIKFTNDGCIVLKISYRAEMYGINMSVSVKDTGIGIDKEHLEKLFTSYNQVDTKRNRQEGGIGLGLAISKAIIEKMGGFISVNSEQGKGSEFKFVIPQKVQDYEPIAKVEDLKRLKVLIYINLEHFPMVQIRDAYNSMIINIANSLGVGYHFCHNLAELKRRLSHNYTTHVFISYGEYMQDPEFFDKTAEQCGVVVAIDEIQDRHIKCNKILKLYKPFYVLPVVNLLNGESSRKTSNSKRFVAPNARILVVDDNEINLKVVSGLLKPYKIKIVTATSGAEALDKIEDKNFDIVFMDHMMPEMDGVETLKRIRNKNNLYYKEVPIIVLTANAVAGAREMFLKEGFQEFISKPVELTVLDRELKNYLPEDKLIFEDDPRFESLSEKAMVNISQEKNIINLPEPEDNENSERELELGDICIEDGITYCGTKEDYIDVLQIHCKNGEKNRKELQDFYDNKDWKNYTILVHALKSSMKTIGAQKLSELAKHLEAAGKLSEVDYIINNHDEMMQEYNRVLDILYKCFDYTPVEKKELDLSELSEVSREELGEIVSKMEDAMYQWDGDKMAELLVGLDKCRLGNNSMKEIIDTINAKIDMSDYMSACETLKHWIDKH